MYDWPSILDYARAVLDFQGPLPLAELYGHLARDGVLPVDDDEVYERWRYHVANARRRGEFPALPTTRPRGRQAPKWGPVLDRARALVEAEGPMPLVRLYETLVDEGVLEDSAAVHKVFRTTVANARRRGEFPELPTADPDDPAPDELGPSPWELWTERLEECWQVLSTVTGVRTMRLSPRAFAVLADQGWGEEIVLHAVQLVIRQRLARLRWEVSGVQRVPVVERKAA